MHLLEVLVFAESERNELEAGRKPGQLPPHLTAVSFCSAVVQTQRGHRSLKKTEARPRSGEGAEFTVMTARRVVDIMNG